MAYTAQASVVPGQLMTAAFWNTYVRDDVTFVYNAIWPVGSIFLSVSSTNPNTLLGLGTWVAFGTGRTLVGIDVGQTEFDVVEETGGEKTHVLTLSEIPAHHHTEDGWDATSGDFHASGAAGQPIPKNTGDTGGGSAHNNMPPFIVVYMWKRTA